MTAKTTHQFKYDVDVAYLEDGSNPEMDDMFVWFATNGMRFEVDYKIKRLSGSHNYTAFCTFGFVDPKRALEFKLTWG